MQDTWVLTRVVVVFAVLFGVPLFFALRAMSREMRKDARIGLNVAQYDRLLRKLAAIAASAIALGIWYRSWLLILGFGGFAAAMIAIIAFSQRSTERSS